MQADTALARRASVSLPWAVWSGEQIALDFPEGLTPIVLRMDDGLALTAAEIEAALDAPIEAEPLQVLARGCRRVAIAVDDPTRPTRAAALLSPMIARLLAAGIPESAISIVIASGAHRAASRAEIERKIGVDLCGRVNIVVHDCERDLVGTGVQLAGVPVRINRTFAEADLRIGICAVMPHPFAAFSGGGKIVVPGVADLDVVARSHKFALMGMHGGDTLEKNRFRLAMEAAVREVGLHWTVNVAVNSACDVAAARAGDFVAAHRAAALDVARIGRTPRPPVALDALVVNAFPKDGELLQVEASLVALRTGVLNRLRADAPIVLSAACRDGLGTHRLLGPGGRLYRPAAPKNVLQGRELIAFVPGVDEAEARAVFCDRYAVTSTWNATVDHLRRRLGPRATIGVLPCAPLQVMETGNSEQTGPDSGRFAGPEVNSAGSC